MAEVLGSLTARGAEAWTSGGIRQVSLAIVGHFFRSGGNGFLFPFLSLNSPQKGLWNRTTISLRVMEDAAWKFRWFVRLYRLGRRFFHEVLVVNAEG